MRFLSHILERDQIPHALLFSGPKGGGKKKAAYQFAAALLKTDKHPENHPDIHLIFPEGKTGMHPLSSIRKLAQEAALAPYEGAWKIFILHEAEKCLPTSSNALLKTLEEPPPRTVIILISNYPERLLPTIVSRCQTVEFPPGDEKNIDLEMLKLLAEGISKEKLSTFDSQQPDLTFETIFFWYRDRLLVELPQCEAYMHFPQYLENIQKIPFIPLEEVEKALVQARLAYERSTKLSTCLEMAFLYLNVL